MAVTYAIQIGTARAHWKIANNTDLRDKLAALGLKFDPTLTEALFRRFSSVRGRYGRL